MKGTEKIIAHIKADAEAEAEALLAEAKKQCAEITKDYESKAKAAYDDKFSRGSKAQEDISESRVRIAHMESKKDLLSLKQEMVSKSFDKAREMILNMPEKDYIGFLTKLIVNSVSTGDEQIVLGGDDAKKYGKAVIEAANEKLGNGKLTLSEKIGDFKGGAILSRGAVEVNSTLDLLIDLAKNEMSSELAKVLFE